MREARQAGLVPSLAVLKRDGWSAADAKELRYSLEACTRERLLVFAREARDAGFGETDISRYVERGILKDDDDDHAEGERRPGIAAAARLTGAAALLASKLDRGR